MELNYRSIIHITGKLFIITGLLMLLPLLIGFLYHEPESIRAFVVVGAGCFMVGALISICVKPSQTPLKTRDGFLIVALAWVVISAISAMPYVIEGCIPSYSSAFFEAASGYSTTGASILNDVESLPKAMLFWRSFAHWLGGMGILVFAIALMPELGIGGDSIARVETPGPIFSKIAPKMVETARFLYIMYIAMTLLLFGLLLLGGMNVFDSLIHTFGTVGTGGFSNYNDSIAHFDSGYIEIVITVFMLLAGVSFNLYYLTITGGLAIMQRDSEMKLYFLIFAVATLAITFMLRLSDVCGAGEALRKGAFQTASIVTTTGFVTADYNLWPTFCMMMLVLLFFVGGCSGSTAGGIKVIRILVLFRAMNHAISAKLHPNAMIPVKVSRKIIPTETISNIAGFLFMYIATVFVTGIVVCISGTDVISGMSAAASCVGNIGPAFGDFGPMNNYAALPGWIQMVLGFAMLAGRLELYTFFVLFSRHFWNPYRY